MLKRFVMILMVLGLIVASTSLVAAVEINSITGTWANPSPVSGITINNTNTFILNITNFIRRFIYCKINHRRFSGDYRNLLSVIRFPNNNDFIIRRRYDFLSVRTKNN